MEGERQWVSFRVVFKGQGVTVRLPRDARLDELSLLLHSSFAAHPSTQKLLLKPNKKGSPSHDDVGGQDDVASPTRAKKSGAAVEDGTLPSHDDGGGEEAAARVVQGKAESGSSRGSVTRGMLMLSDPYTSALTLAEAGIVMGSTFNLLASTDSDLTYVSSLTDDPTLPNFEEEMARESRRHQQQYTPSGTPSSAPVAPLGGYGFGEFRVLKASDIGVTSLLPPSEEAMRILHALATDWGVVEVMRKYKWRVGILTEMPPEGKVGVSPRCILGFNVNRGQEISLRLRTDDLKGFRKMAVIRSTLIHELTHMVHDEHDNSFKALNSKLVKESSVLLSGHKLGAAAPSSAPRFGVGVPQVQPRAHVLGRGSQFVDSDPKASAAAAALRRLEQQRDESAIKKEQSAVKKGEAVEKKGGAAAINGGAAAINGEAAANHREAAANKGEAAAIHGEAAAREKEAAAKNEETAVLQSRVEEGRGEGGGLDGREHIDPMSILPSSPRPSLPDALSQEGLLGQEREIEGLGGGREGDAWVSEGIAREGTGLGECTVECGNARVPDRSGMPSSEMDVDSTPVLPSGETMTSANAATVPAEVGDMAVCTESEEVQVSVPHGLDAVAESARDAQRRVEDALRNLDQQADGSREAVTHAVLTVRTILRNVLEHPQEQKYRTIRKANRALQATLGRFPAALDILRVAGFKDTSNEAGEVLFCRTPDPGLIWLACSTVEQSQTTVSRATAVS